MAQLAALTTNPACFTSTREACRGKGLARNQRVQLACRRQTVCRAQGTNLKEQVGMNLAAVGAAALLALSPAAALAGEFDLLAEPRPTNNYVLDDASVINRTTKGALNNTLNRLETETGYRLEVATVRKLETESDAFVFGDKLISNWYPQEGSKKGILLVVTTAKDGALTGGPDFLKAVGDGLVDSVVQDNIPILTEQEKFNETVSSVVSRVEAVLKGEADPGPPARKDGTRVRNYKTKGETDKNKGVTGTIVLTLLFISVVVPMLQYWGYTSKE